MFNTKEVLPGIFHLNFNEVTVMAETMLRFQEYFESPFFRGKIFTLEEFSEWYKKDRNSDTFTYYDDWEGFNFPSTVLKNFLSGKFNPLSNQEKRVVEYVKTIKKDKFYLIATAGDDLSALMHEVGHALYYTDERYKKNVDDLLSLLGDEKSTLERLIIEYGYHPSVAHDEVHAWLIDGVDFIKEELSFNPTKKEEERLRKVASSLIINLENFSQMKAGQP